MGTTIYGILGHPVDQVRSPAVFNAMLEQAGRDARMVPLDVTPQDFITVLAGLRSLRNFAGMIVTIPHKLAAAGIAVVQSPRVKLVGAANVLKPIPGGWQADLFDGVGFVHGMRSHGYSPWGALVAVVGAGGAGLAIAEALLAQGAHVQMSDVDQARAAAAVARLAQVYGEAVSLGQPSRDHDVAVNATPVGMGDDPGPRLPFDPQILRPGALVAEAIMKPPVTQLLRQAQASGHPILEGRHMLDGQAQAIWDFLEMDRCPVIAR